jgi:UDP-glucose 4-epimerase
MRLFVTGGAGYVGSHCVRALLSAGHSVTVFDNLSYGHRAAVHPDAALIHGDLSDAARVAEVIKAGRFDAVLHFAAWLNVGESVAEPLKYWRNNVANTLNLLEAMQAAGVKRLVFSSTCAIFGEPAALPIHEELPKNPINPYGATKLAVELMLNDCAAAWGLGSTALRYFNASGAASDGSIGEDHRPENHLIPLILQVALGQRDKIKIFGNDYPTPDGTCVRDYIHVEDLADAHRLAVEAIQPGKFECYNVGTGTPFSVQQVIETCRAVTGHPIPAETVARRPGDPPALYADSRKLQKALGWSPKFTDIRAIVESAWNWHKTHPNGFGD